MSIATSLLVPPFDYEAIAKRVTVELTRAAAGQKTSYQWIPNYLPQQELVGTGIIQVVTIGGSVCHVAKYYQSGRSVAVLEKTTGSLPVFATVKIFLAFLTSLLSPDIKALGLNFAYPLRPTSGKFGELDGVLLYATKEHTFTGLVGKAVGKTIHHHLVQHGFPSFPVSVANDTVCLTLADKTAQASCIVGTGFNIALNYQEAIINLEAANFTAFRQSVTGKQIDAASRTPGKNCFEKELAGGYLLEHYNRIVKTHKLPYPKIDKSVHLTTLASEEGSMSSELARALLTRSASLVACQLAGIYLFLENPPSFPIVVEGSLFWNGWHYKETVSEMLGELGVPQGTVKFLSVEDSSLKGALGLIAR